MLLEIVILILSIPTGFLIAHLAKDELAVGRKYFRVLIIASVLIGIWFYLTGVEYLVWTMAFVFVVSLISLIKAK